jgi:hypothetical protein
MTQNTPKPQNDADAPMSAERSAGAQMLSAHCFQQGIPTNNASSERPSTGAEVDHPLRARSYGFDQHIANSCLGVEPSDRCVGHERFGRHRRASSTRPKLLAGRRCGLA